MLLFVLYMLQWLHGFMNSFLLFSLKVRVQYTELDFLANIKNCPQPPGRAYEGDARLLPEK